PIASPARGLRSAPPPTALSPGVTPPGSPPPAGPIVTPSPLGVPISSDAARKAARKRSPLWFLLPILLAFPACLLGAVMVKRLRGHGGRERPSTPVVAEVLRCEPAKLRGEVVDAELARAIGIGMCARLAVEADVEWGVGGDA